MNSRTPRASALVEAWLEMYPEAARYLKERSMDITIKIDDDLIASTIESGLANIQWGRGQRVITVMENGTKHKLVLTKKNIALGLVTMSRVCPSRFKDFLNDQCDMITGDVLIQCMLFGEVRYG